MASAKDLRLEVKRAFAPYLAELGFDRVERGHPLFYEFRRRMPQRLELVDVQWARYGNPSFVVNFGTCPLTGIAAVDGGIIPAEDVRASWAPDSGRLQARRGALMLSWFRQKRPFYRRMFGGAPLYPARDVVAAAVAYFPEVLEYWSSGKKGSHLQIVSYSPPWHAA